MASTTGLCFGQSSQQKVVNSINSQDELTQIFQDAIQTSIRSFVLSKNREPDELNQIHQKLSELLENPKTVVFEKPPMDKKWPDHLVQKKIDACAKRTYLFNDYIADIIFRINHLQDGYLKWGGNLEDGIFELLYDRLELLKKIQSRLPRWEQDHSEKVAILELTRKEKTCGQVRKELELVEKVFFAFVDLYLSSKKVKKDADFLKQNIKELSRRFD